MSIISDLKETIAAIKAERPALDNMPKITAKQLLILMAVGDRKMYGLGICDAIEQVTEGRCKIHLGSVYPLLHTLEKQGLLTSEWSEETVCGARRRYYSCTPTGMALLQRELGVFSNLVEGNFEVKPHPLVGAECDRK